MANTAVIVADRWYPSSKLCSKCNVKKRYSLAERADVDVPIVQHDPQSRIERGREFGTIPGEFKPMEPKALTQRAIAT